jgi:signal transduction histidine kinase
MNKTARGLSLSFKLTATYSMLILLVSGVLTISLYFQLRAVQRRAFRERLHDIVSFAVPLVDGDFHVQIVAPKDQGNPYYRTILARLQTIQATSSVITHIYTLRREGDRLVYIVDASPMQIAPAHVGQEYRRGDFLLTRELLSEPVMIEDEFYFGPDGVFLRGYAPILDSAGTSNGILGIEIDAAEVFASESQALRNTLAGFLATVPLALLLGWWLARRFTSPIGELLSGAERVAQRDLQQEVPVRSRDELGVLALAFNTMQAELLRSDLQFEEYTRSLEQHVLERTIQLETQIEQAITLNRITQMVASAGDLHTALTTVAQETGELLDASYCMIALLDASHTHLTVAAEWLRPIFWNSQGTASFFEEDSQRAMGLVIRVAEHPFMAQVIALKKSQVMSQPDVDFFPKAVHHFIQTRAVEGLLLTPLLVRGAVTGVVGVVIEQTARSFKLDEIRLAETVAGQVAGAIENARLFSEEQRQRRMAESLREVAVALTASLNLDTVLAKIMEQLRQVIQYDSAGLLLRQGEELIVSRSGQPGRAGNIGRSISLSSTGPAARVFKSRRPLVIADVEDDPHWLRWPGDQIRSWMGVALLAGEKPIGVLTVDSFKVDAYSEDDAQVVQIFANQAAIAIENARLYAEAQEARLAAETANQAKSDFLSNVSHELRTPLTSILGFARLIEKRLEEVILPKVQVEGPKTDRAIRQTRENIQIIVAESNRLTSLINDVLDLAKIEAGRMEWHMEPLAVTEVIERAVAATTTLFTEKQLQRTTIIEDGLPEIIGDRDRLIQVVINLLSNAAKFTDTGSVTCRARQLDGEIIISVIDTGSGIAPADQLAVFEKFKQVGDTLTDKPKGTGLGLPICQQIVEHHAGRIWVESEVGVGSNFSFSLPVKEQL